MPGVAVIIPLFEGERWIRATLESVLAQETAAAEIVVVDDGSSDAGPEIADDLDGVRMLRNPGKSSTSARNFGLARTRAPNVAFLDHDDLWHPGHLTMLSLLLSRHVEATAATATCSWFKGAPPAWPPLRSDAASTAGLLDIWQFFPFAFGLACPALGLMRRRVVEGIGGWDERFTGLSDLNLWLRVAAEGPFIASPNRTVAKRIHPDSMMSVGRRDLPAFLALRYRSMQAALEHRTSRGASPAMLRRWENGLAILEHADRLAGCADRGDWFEFPEVARALEHSILENAPDRAEDAVGYAATRLGIRSEQFDDQVRPVLQRFLEHWPDDAPVTKRAVEAQVAAIS